MLPTQQGFPYSGNANPSLYSLSSLPSLTFSGTSFPSQSFVSTNTSFLSTDNSFTTDNSLRSNDADIPEHFKENIQIALNYTANIARLSETVLLGIENAYHSGANPTQTATDIAELKHNLVALSNLLQQTGVGALPVLPLDAPPYVPPDDQRMVQDVSKAVQELYEKRKRMQESNAVVASLLSASEGTKR